MALVGAVSLRKLRTEFSATDGFARGDTTDAAAGGVIPAGRRRIGPSGEICGQKNRRPGGDC
jgi:hypothetical protein